MPVADVTAHPRTRPKEHRDATAHSDKKRLSRTSCGIGLPARILREQGLEVPVTRSAAFGFNGDRLAQGVHPPERRR